MSSDPFLINLDESKPLPEDLAEARKTYFEGLRAHAENIIAKTHEWIEAAEAYHKGQKSDIEVKKADLEAACEALSMAQGALQLHFKSGYCVASERVIKRKLETIYFAGPDVFKRDYGRQKEEIKALCADKGLRPLLPGDLRLDNSKAIYQVNLGLIDQADAVSANLNPFRGVIEPDSGTVFERAYALAKGKPVIGYLHDRRDMLTKLRQTGTGPPPDGTACPDGTWVEDFGLPLNLMLAQGLTAIAGSLKEAVGLAASYKKRG
jgi:nucleoside 2-deoxyribosyltransferase